MVRIVIALALVAGCKERNSLFCEGHPDDPRCLTDGPVAACTTDTECAPQVCDIGGTNTCVECTADKAAACTDATPVCGDDLACRGCVAHAECPDSNACLPDGSCADEADVAYVDPDGGGTNCTLASPCSEVSVALATNRGIVKFTGTTNEQVALNDRDVMFLADPGAKLTDTSNGILLRIDGSSEVSIYDLEISGASGAGNPGISLQPGNTASVLLTRVKVDSNQGGGISASGGTLTVSQSTLTGNQGGGISVMNGTFVIVGNVFFGNGSISATVGGVVISTSQNAANRLEFNSFNKNQTVDGVAPAIQCIAGTFTARNNIMSDNGTLTNMNQTGGTCSHAFSITRPGAIPSGTGNSSDDPLFVNTTTGDLHLMTGSPALGAADPSSVLNGVAERDIDGDLRENPADLGADEVP